MWIGGAYVVLLATVPTMPAATWMNIAASYDGDLASDNIKVWINSVQSVTPVNETGDMTRLNPEPRLIGKAGINLGGHRANGRVDALQIFDQALTQTDVTNIYNSGVGREL